MPLCGISEYGNEFEVHVMGFYSVFSTSPRPFKVDSFDALRYDTYIYIVTEDWSTYG